jgi:hypothetical protein
MWPSHWTENDDELNGLLHRWRGANAQAWEYSVSHGQLLIRLHREETNPIPSAYILCKNCHSVHFESGWKGADMSFTVAPGSYGPLYTFTDGKRLTVVCGAAFGAETDVLISIAAQPA